MSHEISMKIIGMRCAGCAAGIEKKLKDLTGVEEVVVDFPSTRARVRFIENLLTPQRIASKVQDLGYKVFPWEQPMEAEKNHLARKLVPGLLLFIPIFYIGMFVESTPHLRILQASLSLVAFFLLGWEYLVSAAKGLIHGIFGMDILIAIGSSSALIFSMLSFTGWTDQVYFDGAIAILVFITFGKVLEEKAKKSAFASLEELMLQDRKKVRVLRSEKEIEEQEVEKLVIGESIIVPGGEVIPVDGKVLEGESSVDESFLSGEAVPIFKQPGDEVYSGSKNLEQGLVVEVCKVASDSTMAQVAQKIREAQMDKASLQRIADRIAGYFVPIVLVIAALTAFYWAMLEGLVPAVLNSVSVLLIACPCALGLATPAAFSVGLSRGLKKGIMIRSLLVIENISRVTHLVLDKTGTLTQGRPALKAVIHLYQDKSREELLCLLAGLEVGSSHPFAKGILELCKKENIAIQNFSEVLGSAGKGIMGVLNAKVYRAGNRAFLQEAGIVLDETVEKMGFYLCEDEKILAFFEFEDPPREGLASLGDFLARSSVQSFLLSGDRQVVVEDFARHLPFTHVRGELSPEDKRKAVEKLKDEGAFVAMVGDGINDSSALAQADLGISFQEGSDMAKGSADLVLMKSDLSLIQKAFELSYAIHRKILQNYFWAFCYNLVAIPLAAMGQLNPMIAATAMALSSLSVVINSLLLKRV